ncbi:hypothetical protein RUM43_014660 [Polyplax serrata]|uniref:Uncharacterized protein n=1 Tax=Polyplax serrata TaxID=468196 RepID=A0AAN8S9J2_POLSC
MEFTKVSSTGSDNAVVLSDCEVNTFEEAQRRIVELTEKCKNQGAQLLVFRRKIKIQQEMAERSHVEKAAQLQALSSQMVLLEAGLVKKQDYIRRLLASRDRIIAKQQEQIEQLKQQLSESRETGATVRNPEQPLTTNSSAMVVASSGSHSPPLYESVTVARSVTDIITCRKKYRLKRSGAFKIRADFSVRDRKESTPSRICGSTQPTPSQHNSFVNHRTMLKPKDVKRLSLVRAFGRTLKK